MDRGERDEDGLNKCYSVLLRYSHHLPHGRGHAATARRPPQTAERPLSRLSLSNFEGWQQRGWKFAPALLQFPFGFPDLQGSEIQCQQEGTRERSQDAGLARTQPVVADIGELANRQQTPTPVNRTQAERNKRENQGRITSTDMRDNSGTKKNGTLQSILLPLVSYRI